ncbi:unnamed protein product [Allacma fusca]|uniref:Uncharacterized protein n=1 Tax=Allacma fusca TaxID=39272 RepID=A0A8J2LMV8_9HEXA|nr:unnamed protein product [Allacma fusca]
MSLSTGPNPSGGMTREELLTKVPEWSLGCDNALLNMMKDFSESIAKSSWEITESCDSLLNDVDLLEFQVANVTNQFLMLSNTQFVENCVQEFQEYNLKEEKREETRATTKAEKEAALIEKMKEAIRIGVNVQRDREQTRLSAVEESLSASTDSRFSSSVNLAHLIGSSKFFSSRYCGLLSEGRLNRGTCINSRASSAASGSTNTEEYDKVPFPNYAVPVKSLYVDPELDDSQSTYTSSVQPALESVPAAISNITAYSEYPKVLPTNSDFRPKTVEQSSIIANQPPKPSTIFFPTPPRPPSSTSSSSNSFFEDNLTIPNDPDIFDGPKVNSRPRSITPPDIRPPPIMDLSDSDEEFFKPVQANDSFNSYFGNQQKQLISPNPYSEPPPQPDRPPQFATPQPIKTQTPIFQPQQDNQAVHTVGSNSPKMPQFTAPPPPPPILQDLSTAQSSTIQSVATTSASQQTIKPAVEKVLERTHNHSTTNVGPVNSLYASNRPSKSEESKSHSLIVTENRSKEVGREILNPKPESVNKLPPKRTSIFDSSDSDDDLFSSFSSKGVKKNSLFNSTPPKFSANSSSTKSVLPIERRPPPILDLSDDSDEDIFKSVDLPSNIKSKSFSDHMPQQPANEQLRDVSESSNLFSPATYTVPPEREPETNSRPAMSPVSVGESFANVSPEETTTIVSEPVFHPEQNSKHNHDSNHISNEAGFESQNNPSLDVDDTLAKQVPAFKTDSLFKSEVVTTNHDQKLQSNNNIMGSPPITQDVDDDEDIFISHMAASQEDSFNHSSSVVASHNDSVSNYSQPSGPVVPPKFKPQHQEKVKSIFDSSDSDDDLFSSKLKTKSTPTLREISPQPNPSNPHTNESRFPVLDKSEIRPPPILDMSDSSSDDDLFKPVSKPKSPAASVFNVPQPVGPSSVPPSIARVEPPMMQTPVKSVAENIINNDVKESSVHEAKTKVPSPILQPKPKKEKFIFDSSDSDDDLFSSAKSKPNSSLSVKALVSKMPTIITPKAVTGNKPAPAKANSLFSDSDDEGDGLFETGKNMSKINLIGNSLPDVTPEEDSETGRVILPLPPKSDSPVLRKKGGESISSIEKRFGAVTKSLENMFSAKNLKMPGSTSSASQDIWTESASFEEQVSTENLLHCITRDRPKILHPRRPPSLRKQIMSHDYFESYEEIFIPGLNRDIVLLLFHTTY